MFSGFIFDVEGTLVDSVPQNLRSLQDALERHRIPRAVSNPSAVFWLGWESGSSTDAPRNH
jgi:phosphoglycolate phosphatase-like HAD superfamily hydrolase